MSKQSSIDAKVRADMQRKYSGLDDSLDYIEGHTIHSKYVSYKDAAGKAGTASSQYKSTAQETRAKLPYDPTKGKATQAGGKMFYPSGHQILEPLAGYASTSAGQHADSRERFNMEYQDLMTVKHEYDGHVKQAEMARQSEKKYAALERQHRKYR